MQQFVNTIGSKIISTSAQAQDSQYMVSYIYGSVLENKSRQKRSTTHF